ncbi:MAG: phage tail tape measure protein [Bacteroidales bacterium]|nr:phage tail tape measure protein [Candidatus Scybalousia scybalohippi]
MAGTNQILFQINVNGNANEVVAQLTQNIKGLKVTTNSSINNIIQKFGSLSLAINQSLKVVEGVVKAMQSINEPAKAFDSSLQELSAITGVAGEGLEEIGDMAKDVSKRFGTDAAQGVESFKLLLSQLSPELAKTPEVMKKMSENVATLSKTMGGDTTAAAQVLTTAMNQYGVSMEDPIEAEREMARMMNVMAAAAKEGSAELPQIQEALKQSGMAAKSAGVSFEETNAAIQVLDKAGRKGAEGGVALRNVMSTLAQGRFLPKDVQEELRRAGINVNVLTDNSRSLKDRLEVLKPVLQDQALLSKLFGRENAASAMALIGNTQALEAYTKAVTGTNTATEQAATIMQSYEERHNRLQAQIEALKIKIFDISGGISMYVQTIGEMIIPLGQLYPVIQMLIASFKGLRAGIMLIGPAFKVMSAGAVSACRSIGVAIMNIPVIGWIAALVAALVAAFAYFWNTSAKFRAVVKGSWAYVVSITKEAWGVLKKIFGALADMIKAAVKLDFKGVKEAAKGFTNVFKDFGKQSAQAYNDAYNEEMAKSKKEEEAKQKKEKGKQSAQGSSNVKVEDETGAVKVNTEGSGLPVTGGATQGGSGTSSAGTGGGSGVRTITTNIANLIGGDIVIHTTQLKESAAEIKRIIIEALQDATNEATMV